MRYLALGDSISIDDYTGVPGGGAVSQFARFIDASGTGFQDLSGDGFTSAGVLRSLDAAHLVPDVVTLTAGGNDLLLGVDPGEIARNIDAILDAPRVRAALVILNTVYDPSDGDDSAAQLLGVSPNLRIAFDTLNAHIRAQSRREGVLIADLERLFYGHGIASGDPWLVQLIEPNHAGATAIARLWFDLFSSAARPNARG